jgi:hypothetical protein
VCSYIDLPGGKDFRYGGIIDREAKKEETTPFQ